MYKIRPGNSPIRGRPQLGYNPNPKGVCFSLEFLAGGLAAGDPLGGPSCSHVRLKINFHDSDFARQEVHPA